MKIGIHGLFKRCVLLRNWKLGKSLMPCLSYLKFPSFTDNACNSLTLDAVANAIKNTVFHVKNFISQDKIVQRSNQNKTPILNF